MWFSPTGKLPFPTRLFASEPDASAAEFTDENFYISTY